MRTVAIIGLAAAAMGIAGTARAQERSYRADANATKSVDLSLCTSSVRLRVNGDGDTDLDFTVTDNRGNVVHRDFDSTDLTFATLTPNVSGGCVTYVLRVQNRGGIYNNFTVTLTDQAAAARNRTVAIHNHTAEAFRSIYYKNTAEEDWGSDRLGADIQRARTNRNFDINDGTGACKFDIRVETASGRSYIKRNVDVCAVSTVDFGTEVSH